MTPEVIRETIRVWESEPDRAKGRPTVKAWADGSQALVLLRGLELPFERAQTQARAGVALVAAGRRNDGIQQLSGAYQTARKLGARALAGSIAREVSRLGERVETRLGQRAATDLKNGGLTRREVEVLRLVAVGLTNREIGQELFLSERTVDMHVRHLLATLDCRSRSDATRRAAELGVLRLA